MRHRLLALFTASLTGCTAMSPAPPEAVAFRCEAGRTFSVTPGASGDTAIIDIGGMRFALDAQPAGGPGERYGCGVLTLWRDGDTARVEMDGAGLYQNCRRQVP
jgi:membrane-bound inhibitor of C-type lysozyme